MDEELEQLSEEEIKALSAENESLEELFSLRVIRNFIVNDSNVKLKAINERIEELEKETSQD